MYVFFNVVIHLTFICLLVYVMIPEKNSSRYDDMSLKKLTAFAAVGIFVIWTLFVGLAYNVKQLYMLVL